MMEKFFDYIEKNFHGDIRKDLLKFHADMDELICDKKDEIDRVNGKLYDAERTIRIMRRVGNDYFKQESEELEKDLPY